MLIQLLILLTTGLAIGFLSGLLGIGGGIIMTPVQYWIYTSAFGMSPDLAIKIAFATSLAAILPTAASGVLRHQRLGGIYWRAAIFMGIFTSIGSFIGATLASHIPGSTLKIIFGFVTLGVAVRMITLKVSEVDRPVKDNLWLWLGLAFPIGIITGLLGIGGGIFVVPLLVLVLGFRFKHAAGTSLAMMLFTSVGGIIGYIFNGINAHNLPDFTIGYIYWPAWIALTVGSLGMVQWGAHVAHKASERVLNAILVTLLIYISLDMLGVIEWILSLL
jgi:uncharacterized membrane protein YfcA